MAPVIRTRGRDSTDAAEGDTAQLDTTGGEATEGNAAGLNAAELDTGQVEVVVVDEAEDPAPPWTAQRQLGLALLFMTGPLVGAHHSSLAHSIFECATAGVGLGIVLTAVMGSPPAVASPPPGCWWRHSAVIGAAVFQLGVLAGADTTFGAVGALWSLPTFLCAGGGMAVAAAAWWCPEPDGDSVAWPRWAAAGAGVGFTTLALGATKLLSLESSTKLGSGGLGGALGGGSGLGGGLLQMLGGSGGGALSGITGKLQSLVQDMQLVLVVLIVTPIALGAILVVRARAPRSPSAASFVYLALIPVLAVGGIGDALAVGVTAAVSGFASVAHRVAAPIVLPAVVLVGAAAAAMGGSVPLPFFAAVVAYGALLGVLVEVVRRRSHLHVEPAPTSATVDQPGHHRRVGPKDRSRTIR
jgi:hypothetical protein